MSINHRTIFYLHVVAMSKFMTSARLSNKQTREYMCMCNVSVIVLVDVQLSVVHLCSCTCSRFIPLLYMTRQTYKYIVPNV